MFKYFYCESCGKIYTAKLEGELTTTDKRLEYHTNCWYKCPCGEYAVEIDQGMLLIIQSINKTQFKTKFCCEGHLHINKSITNRYEPSYIAFANSVTMEMFNDIVGKCPLPNGWEIDIDDSEGDRFENVCIKYKTIDDIFGELSETEFEIKKKCYLMELSRWVNKVLIEERDKK